MQDKTEEKTEEKAETQNVTVEELQRQIKTLQEQVVALANNPGAPQAHVPAKDTAESAVMTDKLNAELGKQLNACKDKIKSVLVRAKFVSKHGLKITGEVVMKNPADVKVRDAIVSKMSQTITTYGDCVSTMAARGIWVETKGKAPEYKISVNVQQRK